MVLTIENAGALVPGVQIKEVSVQMQRVKILSSFSDGQKSLEKDSIQIIPKWMAVQALDANRVEFLPDEEKTVEVIQKVTPEELKAEVKVDLKETVDKNNISHPKKK